VIGSIYRRGSMEENGEPAPLARLLTLGSGRPNSFFDSGMEWAIPINCESEVLIYCSNVNVHAWQFCVQFQKCVLSWQLPSYPASMHEVTSLK
jgi:hypothetical protein